MDDFARSFPLLKLDPDHDIMSQLLEIRKSNHINSQMVQDSDHAIFKFAIMKREFTRQQSRRLLQQIQQGILEKDFVKPNEYFSNSIFDKPFHWTPLHCACYYGKLNVVKQLLDLGYEITLRDQWFGGFALAWAAYGNQPEVCKFLIEKGADVTQTNFYGQTAHDMTQVPLHSKWEFLMKYKSEELVKMLDILQLLKENSEKGRKRAEVFLDLPPKELYPSYYVVITNPVCIKDIEMKLFNFIKLNQHYSAKDMASDIMQMFDNAFTFNEDNSIIYKDALQLQHLAVVSFYEKFSIQLNRKGKRSFEAPTEYTTSDFGDIYVGQYIYIHLEENTFSIIADDKLIMFTTDVSSVKDTIKGRLFVSKSHASHCYNFSSDKEYMLTSLDVEISKKDIKGKCWILPIEEYTKYLVRDTKDVNLYFCETFYDFKTSASEQIKPEHEKYLNTCPSYKLVKRKKDVNPLERLSSLPKGSEYKRDAKDHLLKNTSNLTYASYLTSNKSSAYDYDRTGKRDGWTSSELAKMMNITEDDLVFMLSSLNPPESLRFSQSAVEMLLKKRNSSDLEIKESMGIGYVRVKSQMGASDLNSYVSSFGAYSSYKPQSYGSQSSSFARYTNMGNVSRGATPNYRYQATVPARTYKTPDHYIRQNQQRQQQQSTKASSVAMSENKIEIPELEKMNMLQTIIMDCGENSWLYEIDTTEQKHYCFTIPEEVDSINVAPVISKKFYEILKEVSDESPFRSQCNFDFVQYYIEVSHNGKKLVSHMVDVTRSMIKGEEVKECYPNLIYYPASLHHGSNLFDFKTVFRVFDYEPVEGARSPTMNKSDSAVNVNENEEKSPSKTISSGANRPVFRYQSEQQFYIVVNTVVQ
eukprot:NODE_416_length_7838_cov_1.514537.p1 type:complete len:866 gc:universal NODE_416_length_7838_cov_1.514537:6196-3599(-)